MNASSQLFRVLLLWILCGTYIVFPYSNSRVRAGDNAMCLRMPAKSFLGRKNRKVPVPVSSHILPRNCWRSFDAVCYIFQGDQGCSLHPSPCTSIIPVIKYRKNLQPRIAETESFSGFKTIRSSRPLMSVLLQVIDIDVQSYCLAAGKFSNALRLLPIISIVVSTVSLSPNRRFLCSIPGRCWALSETWFPWLMIRKPVVMIETWIGE